MKAIILTAIIWAISLTGNAQLYLQAGGGYSPKVKSPTVELIAGGVLRQQLVISGGIQTHTQNVKQSGCLFQGRIGFQISPTEYSRIIPYIGVAQFYKSSDNKELNYVRPLYALEVNRELRQDGSALYGAVTFTGKVYIISAGIRFSFLPPNN